MRCFAAVDIDEQIRRQLARLQGELKEAAAVRNKGAKWVRPEQIHLTLKFLGEVPDPEIMPVLEVIEAVALRHKAFELSIRGAGCFGRPARVIWVGTDMCEALLQVQSDLEEQLAAIGFPAENRKFAGHLTLCRVKSPRVGRALAQAVQAYADRTFGTIWVDRLCVYKSELTKSGPLYTLVGKYFLRDG